MQSVKSVQWIAMLKHSIHATKCYPYLIVSEPGKMFVHERRIQMDALMGYGLLVLSKCREFPLYYEWCWWFRLRPLNSSGVLVDDGDDFVVVMNGGQITFELLCTVRLASESLPSWYHMAAVATVGSKGGRVPWCHNTNHHNNWYCFFCSGLLGLRGVLLRFNDCNFIFVYQRNPISIRRRLCSPSNAAFYTIDSKFGWDEVPLMLSSLSSWNTFRYLALPVSQSVCLSVRPHANWIFHLSKQWWFDYDSFSDATFSFPSFIFIFCRSVRLRLNIIAVE